MWLPQTCNANAKMLNQAVPKPKVVMQRQEEERVGKEEGGGREGVEVGVCVYSSAASDVETGDVGQNTPPCHLLITSA